MSEKKTVPLPTALYSVSQVRSLDRAAIDHFEVPGETLMQRAGSAAYGLLKEKWPAAKRIMILCGKGNNAGDGYVVAQEAFLGGLWVDLRFLAAPDTLQGDAKKVALKAQKLGFSMKPFDKNEVLEGDVLVDALLGTGLNSDVRGEFLEGIKVINSNACPVLSLDVPSGIDANTGSPLGLGVKAAVTISFVGLKKGLLTGAGKAHAGDLYFDNLGVPEAAYEGVVPQAQRIVFESVKQALKSRARNAHKGDFGHVWIVGGGPGMWGAPRMAGEAALKVGAGRVSVVTQSHHAPFVSVSCPALMSHGADGPKEIPKNIAAADVIVLGPGLGSIAWSDKILAAILKMAIPLVVDADGLNGLAADPKYAALPRDNWILTPHPGEAARLLKTTVAAIEADRFAAVTAIQAQYGGVVVLKGAGTLVCTGPGDIWVCTEGNPGMATAGMGDVLSGVIAGLFGQGLNLAQAACLGVSLHARAGDCAATQGQRGIMATDLMSPLQQCLG